MEKNRLEAFSDGVLAIIITIMVLNLSIPHGATIAALVPLVPTLLSYVLSFIYVGIYWNNHHHMMYVTPRVTGGILWANLHLLFWLSLVPIATAWVGQTHFAAVPVAFYGAVLLMAGTAYWIMQNTIIAAQGPDSALKAAVGKDCKGIVSMVIYAVAIPCALVSPFISCDLYALVAGMWLIPDPRIERRFARPQA